MRIGELHQATGVSIETIRYYEKEGLLIETARSVNGYRIYGKAHLERLSFIRHCRALEMPLAEIRQLLDFINHPEVDCREVNRLIDVQLARVQARLISMRALEQQLSQLRVYCATGTTAAECGVLQELVAAAQNEAFTSRK